MWVGLWSISPKLLGLSLHIRKTENDAVGLRQRREAMCSSFFIKFTELHATRHKMRKNMHKKHEQKTKTYIEVQRMQAD